MMAKGKGMTRTAYAAQLAAERMTGRPHRTRFRSAAMDHGNDQEPIARMKYELRNGVMVQGTGKEFVPHPFITMAGCSPDGLVDDDGLVEFKNPDTHTFIHYWLTREIPLSYQWQMLWQLACTRRTWCDFVAHDPDMPDEYEYLQIRFEPPAAEVAALEQEVRFFNAEVEQLILSIKSKGM